MSKQKVTREKLAHALIAGATCIECQESWGCSKAAIVKAIKRYDLKTFRGFYAIPGRKAGRKPGYKHTAEEIAAMSERMMGKKNPFFGKKHTQETRDKMSTNHADFAGEKNPYKRALDKHPEKRVAASERSVRRWANRSREWRNVFGRKVSLRMASSKMDESKYHLRHKSGHLETRKVGKIFYRSSWEKAVCEYLDLPEDENDVVSFSVEPFCVEYTNSNGKTRYTRIDFLVELRNGARAILEVKPKSLLKYGENMNKAIGIQKYCSEHGMLFFFVHESDLDNMCNIINRISRGIIDEPKQAD